MVVGGGIGVCWAVAVVMVVCLIVCVIAIGDRLCNEESGGENALLRSLFCLLVLGYYEVLVYLLSSCLLVKSCLFL